MIPLFKVFMSESVAAKVSETVQSGQITQGVKVEEFEKLLCDVLETPYVLTLNSATSGLTLAIRMLASEVGFDAENDFVLSTPLTCAATNWPILANGFRLKWIDVDPQTCNMDLDVLEQNISKNTKIIMLVHWAGTPIDLCKLHEILDRKEKTIGFRPRVIQDCAHAFGAALSGKKVNNFGDICVYSLQAIKHITSGDGGVITLPNKELYDRAKLLRWYGIDRNQRNYSGKDFRMENDIAEWGYKFHMNDISATIGIENIKQYDWIINQYRGNAEFYKQELFGLRKVRLLEEPADATSSYWIFTLMVEDSNSLITALKEKGIMASQVHRRNDVHSCVKEFCCDLPNLNSIENSYVCIPVGWWLTDADRNRVVHAIREWSEI